MSAPDGGRAAPVILLSVISGSTDTIGFLTFGLFTAHVTGNFAVLAAHFVTGNPAVASHLLSVPVFMLALLLASVLGTLLVRRGADPLRPLLSLQLLLLASAWVVCLVQGTSLKPGSLPGMTAALLAVAAMGVQNALVQVSLMALPSTAVMTTNVSRLVLAVTEFLTCLDGSVARRTRLEIMHLLRVVLGFVLGSVLGAMAHAILGHGALGLPGALALLALWIARPGRQERAPGT